MESILIKLSGELLSIGSASGQPSASAPPIRNIISQIKKLSEKYHVGLVVGGGNFFRGDQHGKALGISGTARHTAGMLATMINGILLQDLFNQEEKESVLLSAIDCPLVADEITHGNIEKAKLENKIIIFVGGTGKPFFTTDTAAVQRAIQMGSKTVFKATKVDGVYTSDPKTDPHAKKIKTLTCKETLDRGLKIVDTAALEAAEKNGITFRIFCGFESGALVRAVKDEGFGSTIRP
jgi:uridylate kinase